MAEVLVEEEKVLLVFGLSAETGMMLPGSVTLDEVERMVLFCGASAAPWYFWDPFFWLELDWAGGIAIRCLDTLGLSRFARLLL